MTTKKKTMLLTVSIAMVVVLAVVGTLMLFTAKSETATNVVTLGNAKIILQEYDNANDEYGNPKGYTDIDSSFTGLTFNKDKNGKDPMPGSEFTKRPRVKNDADVPVYVFVKMVLSATAKGETSPIDLTDHKVIDQYFGNNDGTLSPEEHAAALTVFGQLVAGINASAENGWFGITPKYNDDGTVSGGYFYVEPNIDVNGGSNIRLKALANKNDVTPDVFTKVVIPSTLPSTFADVKFEVKLTAYAVQSDGNPYNAYNQEEKGQAYYAGGKGMVGAFADFPGLFD